MNFLNISVKFVFFVNRFYAFTKHNVKNGFKTGLYKTRNK